MCYRYVMALLLLAAMFTIWEMGRTIRLLYCNYLLFQKYREAIQQLQRQINEEIARNRALRL